jgi:hypothetical protein
VGKETGRHRRCAELPETTDARKMTEFHYLVQRTYDKSLQITSTTQVTLLHTSNAHYFRQTLHQHERIWVLLHITITRYFTNINTTYTISQRLLYIHYFKELPEKTIHQQYETLNYQQIPNYSCN